MAEDKTIKAGKKKLKEMNEVTSQAGRQLSDLGNMISGGITNMLSNISVASHMVSQEGNSGEGESDNATSGGAAAAVDQLGTSMAAASETMSAVTIPTLNDLISSSLTPLAGQFAALNPEVQGFIDNLAMIAPIIGMVISTIGGIITQIVSVFTWITNAAGAISAFTAGTQGLGATLLSIFGPEGIILLVAAAIAALVAGFIYLWNTNEAFRDAVINIWKEISAVLSMIWENIKKAAKAVINFLSDWWQEHSDNVFDTLKSAWELILTILKSIWENIRITAITVFNKLQTFWDNWGGLIIGIFTVIWNTISGVFDAALKVLSGLFTAFAGLIEGDWQKVWEGLGETFKGIWDGIKAVFKGAINFIIMIFNHFIKKINAIRIKVPEIRIPFVGSFGGFSIGLPHIPSIPLLAAGGIITKPTLAMIGEAGNEAVLPLENSSFIDDFAGTVGNAVLNAMQFSNASSQGSNGDIVIQIDSTKLARVMLPAMDKEQSRKGNAAILQSI